ncbi:MAG: exodeoxyribonuclease VII large subunit, partial [Atribacterota bacterium]
ETGQRLKVGMKILLQGRLRFHPAYGLSLEVQGINSNYSLGEIARKRREILQRLAQEGLLEKNRQISLPLVPQRIAVVSSEHSAGFEDFLMHLKENPYGFRFTVKLFPTLVQGEEAEFSLLGALEAVRMEARHFDVVVVLRGGGSRVDLSCFDSYALGKMVAEFPLPVLTGIGHHRDESVMDCVSYSALKTPTAVADFLVDRVKAFEEGLNRELSRLWGATWETLECYQMELSDWIRRFRGDALLLFQKEREKHLRFEERFDLLLRAFLEKARVTQHDLEQAFRRETVKRLEEMKQSLDQEEKALVLLHPSNVLRRGYTLTFSEGKIVKSVHDCSVGQKLYTQTHDGQLMSEVKERHERTDGTFL